MLVDHLRAFPPASAYIEALVDPPSSSEICRIELLQGLRSSERRRVEALFCLIRWISVDETIARRAGDLGRRWRRSHPGIGVADLSVAATAMELDFPLATRNVKHFPMFPALQAPY